MQDPRKAAKGAPYHLTTVREGCPLDKFWVVMLDCGIEVYQNDKDPNLEEPDPWMRLKQFCADYDVSILGMALGYRLERDPRQINLDNMASGYFYAQRVRMLFGASVPTHYSDRAIGVGQLNDDVLRIVWVLDNGEEHAEMRHLGEQHAKHSTNIPTLIRNS